MSNQARIILTAAFTLGLGFAPIRAHADNDQTFSGVAMLANDAFEAQIDRARRLPHVENTKHSIGERIAIRTARVGGGLVGGASNAALGGAITALGAVADSFQLTYNETKPTDIDSLSTERSTPEPRRSRSVALVAW